MMESAALLVVRRSQAYLAIGGCLAGLVAVIALAMATGGGRMGTTGGIAAPAQSWTAKGAISAALGREQTSFHVTGRRGMLVATNPGQRLRASFGRDGVSVRTGTATFGLRVLGYRAGRRLAMLRPMRPHAVANRVVYEHGALTEWYANGPLGIEQGFDVHSAPPGRAAGLAIDLGLAGNVRVQADGSNGLLLSGPDGQQLRYTGLSASDARGRALPVRLSAGGRRATIHVDARGAVYPVRIDPFMQVAKFGDPTPGGSTGLGGNSLGGPVSVAGTTAAVMLGSASAVDIFVANNGNWGQGATRVARITDPNGDDFGSSVALSSDGRTLAVGAPGVGSSNGAVFVFQEPGGGWADTTTATATAKLVDNTTTLAVGAELGRAVAIAADGSRIAAGEPSFGASANVNPNSGAVAVFDRGGATWSSSTSPDELTAGGAGDALGQAVALSGNTVVAGAIHAGGSNPPGLAYIFQKSGLSWNRVSTLTGQSGGDFFGWATAISGDGRTVVVTAVSANNARGAVYVYTSANGSWPAAPVPAAVLTASNPSNGDQLGESVAIDGNVILAGAFGTTFNNHPFTGAAFIFAEPPGGWQSGHETQEVSAPDGRGGDSFGQAVGLSNGTALIAAPFASAGTSNNQQGFLYAFGSFPTPTVSLTPAAPDGSNGWYLHPVAAAVSASDLASNVTALRCTLDPASAPGSFGALPGSCGFVNPTTVAGDGHHVIFASATNSAGYTAVPVSRAFQIDTVAPTLTCVPSPTFRLRGQGGLVTARVADATSGPAAPLVASPAAVKSIGRKLAVITGLDKAGNATTVKCPYRVAAPKLPTTFSYTFTRFPTFTVFTSLTLKKVPRGATVAVTCHGGGCPLRRRILHTATTRRVCKRHHKHCRRRPAPALQNLPLRSLLAHAHLRPKAKVRLTVTKANATGVVVTFTIRSGAGPRVSGACLAPGASVPKPC